MSAKKTIILLVGLVVSLYLVRHSQDIRNWAKENISSKPYITALTPISTTGPIFKFAVDGTVNLSGKNAFVRVILIDNNNQEYLVYETYSAIEDRHAFSVSSACDETCVLDGISASKIRVESKDGSFIISKTTTSSKLVAGDKQLTKKEADSTKIQKLNELIKKNNKKWTAGETSISKLTYAQKKKLFSNGNRQPAEILPNLQGFEYYKGGVFEIPLDSSINSTSSKILQTAPLGQPQSPPPSNIPPNLVASWDWRNVHGKNWIPPGVKDQMGCASCWAFAAIAATESVNNLYYNQLIQLDLSEQDTVCKHPGSCTYGGSSSDTAYELMTDGLVTEACYPYTGNESCPGRCSDWSSNLWKITNYSWLSWPLTDENIEYNLITKGPITFGISSWWHVMALVGYEKDVYGQTTWLIKNSWGPTWGDNGFGRVYVPENDRYHMIYVEKPYFASKPQKFNISCVDNDHDNYCSWGISESRPQNCPGSCRQEKDCNDNDPNNAPYDQGFNCTPVLKCKPRPACLDAKPHPCLLPITPDMCPPPVKDRP